MKTAKRRVLSFIMAMLTVITTVFGHVDYSVKAETTTTYTKVSSVSDITAGGEFVLVANYSGNYYALGTTISEKITPYEVSVSPEGIVTGETLPVWSIATRDEGVSLTNGSTYLAYGSSTNFSNAKEAYRWNVSASGEGFRFTASGATSRAIAFQEVESGVRFGAYATSNASKSTYAFDLLVFKAGAGSVTPPSGEVTQKCEPVTATPGSGEVEAGTTVALSCATEGATIMYSVNGADFVEYKEAITINENTTISAKAVKAECDDSEAVAFTYTVAKDEEVEQTYDKISEALAGANGTEFTIKGVVTLVDGSNIFVHDTTGGINLYCASTPTGISLGDTVIGTGARGAFNGMPQLGSATCEKSEGFTLSAKETTIGALTLDDIGSYVAIKNLEVTDVYDNSGAYSTPNITVTDGNKTIQLYKAAVGKTDNEWDIKIGDKLDVKAAVGVYQKNNQGNKTLQLRTTLPSEITVIASGDVGSGDNEGGNTGSEDEVKVSTVAEALAGAEGTSFTVKGAVSYIYGKNVYVQDETGAICVYMASTPSGIALGDTVIATGVRDKYNGYAQLKSGTFEKSEGVELVAIKKKVSDITDADVYSYIQLSNVEVTEVYDGNGSYSTPNITVTDGNKKIQLGYAVVGKTDGEWDVQAGDKINMKAVVYPYYNKNTGKITLQLRNMVATEITKAPKLGKVTSAADLTTGTYTMVLETGYAPTVVDGTWILAEVPTVVGNLITNHKNAVWTLTVSEGTAVLTDANGVSIAPMTNGENGFRKEKYAWTVKFDETTGTFSFHGVGNGTAYTLASNTGSNNKFRGYKDTTVTGKYSASYPCDFTLYRVDPDAEPSEEIVLEGSKVVLYNVNAKGVLAAQDDNIESPSVKNVSATVTDGIATVANGGVIFEIQKNGDYYRFYNETYGYLASKGTGSNAFYTKEVSEDIDWKLAELNGGYSMESRTAKYNGKYSQYLEYYAGSYKTYSMYNVSDYSIYEFHFLPCSNEKVTGGIVNEPIAVTDKILDAYVGTDYTFTFEVDAPFGVKELAVTVNGEEASYKESAGIYTVVVPAAKVLGEKLTIAVTGKDTVGETITGTFEVTVKDEPGIVNVTPAAGSQTGNEKKPVISAEIVNAGENATVVMTINKEEVAATYAAGKVAYASATDMEDGRYSVTVTVTRADGKTVTKTWSFTVGKAAYQLYFGQMHSHTTYSDGSGSLASALSYIQNLPESANVDFVAFTDHSNYFDKSGEANVEGALYDMSLATAFSQKTWAEYKNTIAEFNASQSDVVALGGFEMTWSGGPGHMNTFNSEGIVSRNNATLNNKTNDAGMKAYYALLSQNEGADTISQFNHPGSTFGTFSDFAYWDAVIDSRIMLVEVGNGEGQIGAGGYFPSYEYYTMALDKGWHVAPTNNQDNHKGRWGNANDARDVVLTDNFTEEGIYQAIRDMRVYSTEDKNLEVYYTVNGYQLGSSITEIPEKLNINVSVNDPDASDSISKVEVIVNSGKVAYTWNTPSELAIGELSCELDPSYSYYYIRVTEGDGDLAVTAPVWVGDPLKLGISSVVCNTSTPVTEEELTLTTTLFNSELKNAVVKTLTYTVNGGEVVGIDNTGYTVSASGTVAIDFKYVPKTAKLTKITATAIVEQDGEEYTFTMDITLDIADSTKIAYIGIDAAHYNEYVAGNYKDSMGNFSQLAAGYAVRTVELKTSEDLIAACSNDKYKALILTAPSRRNGDAGRADGLSYTAEEIAAIKAFNENGGTVVLAGWSDHYENYAEIKADPTIKHMAVSQNEVLEALGSSIRISDDATYDDTYNSGKENYRLYFNTYGDNVLTEGVEVDPENPHNRLYTEVFSYYGGASIYVVDETGAPTSKLPATVSPVVFGHSTTYSIDTDKDGLGGDATPKYAYASGDNRIMVMAMEEVEDKGAIIVSGAAFMSNFEVQAKIEDSVAEKNYSNYKICENLVQYVNPVTVTSIADVQAQTEAGYKYTIEGIVTSNASGYDKDTAFFDCIYVQDATGGVCCFPVAGNFKIGDKVRVTGTTEFYQGEMELQVSSIEIIGTGSVEAKEVTSAQVNDGSVLGQLITVKGTVVSYQVENGLIQTIMVKDAAGNICRVFIDGYITTDADVANVKVGNKITVTGLASYDDTFNAPDGPFPRIRIRDREDIVCTTVTPVAPVVPEKPFVPSVPSTPEVEDTTTENTTNTTTPTITIVTTPSTGNTVEEEVVIEDEETPLAPSETEEVEVEETEKVDETELEEVEVPLAAGSNNSALSILMVIIVLLAATAGAVVILQKKKAVK